MHKLFQVFGVHEGVLEGWTLAMGFPFLIFPFKIDEIYIGNGILPKVTISKCPIEIIVWKGVIVV